WCFFFQAEDGIRHGHVTGVQTCALPILPNNALCADGDPRSVDTCSTATATHVCTHTCPPSSPGDCVTYTYVGGHCVPSFDSTVRSEERRVGKEWRCRRASGYSEKHESRI